MSPLPAVPNHGSALARSIPNPTAVAKAHLGGSVRADGPCHEPCHEGTAKGIAVSPSPSLGRDPTPGTPLLRVQDPHPPLPPSGGPCRLQHPWLGAPPTSVPLFPMDTPLPRPTTGTQAAPGPPLSPTHLLGGERHADAVLLDEHGGTGRVGRTGVRRRRRRWRGHSSFWGDPGRGGWGARGERWGTARGSLPRSHPITPRSRRPPRSRHR